MSQKAFREWMAIWLVTVIAAAVAIVALLSMACWHLHEGLPHSLLEAVFLAAVLTVTVDPFLKRRLIRDAARDIFHHLLGIDFPPEIRNAFQKALFEGKTYREDAEINAHAQKEDGDIVILEVEVRWTVVAAKLDVEYRQGLSFEESENPSLLQVSITSDRNPKLNYCKFNQPLSPNAEDPLVIEWRGPKIRLDKADRLRWFAKYTVTGGMRDFSAFNFAAPTINLMVRLRPSDGLLLTASHADQEKGNEYSYRKVFVPGDHVMIRWKPKLPLAD